MKVISILVLLMITTGSTAFGQHVLDGVVIDEQSSPVIYANVLAISNVDSTKIFGSNTDENGSFAVKVPTNFQGTLRISALGHKSLDLAISEKSTKLNVVLESNSEILDEVVVRARKMLFEQKSDRLVVNVGAMPSMQGDNALQVLQKSPGVIIQESANSIALAGKGQVQIMINNRISRVPSEVLLKQLQAIPAENIDRVEIIYQPGARYDASNSGIIHIVMKENNLEGFNGNISLGAGYGQKEKGNGSVNLNYRHKKLNVYSSITGYHARSPISEINHYRDYEYLGDDYYYENHLIFTDPLYQSLDFNLGSDFEIDDRTTIGLLVGYTKSIDTGSDYTSKAISYKNDLENGRSSYLIDVKNPKDNNFINVNLFRKIDDQSTLNLDYDRVTSKVKNSSSLNDLNAAGSLNPSRNSNFRIHTVKADFERNTPYGKLQLGAKGTFNSSESNSEVRVEGGISDLDPNFFFREDKLNEKILAGYGSMQRKFSDHWDGELGLRFEHYRYLLEANQELENLDVQYNNLFPVLRINHQLDSLRSLQLTFDRRTTRAPYFLIAGFYVLVDPTLFATSNTSIRPAFTNALRLGYQVRTFLISLEVNRTIGPIAFYNSVDKPRNLQITSPTNFDRMDQAVVNVSFPVSINGWWETNWNLSGTNTFVKDVKNRALPFEKSISTASVQLNNSFQLGNSWSANIDGRYMSPFLSGDQVQEIGSYVNVGVQKKFKNGSSLAFSLQDLTMSNANIEWEYDQPELQVRTFGDNDYSERTIRVTYSFTFGNEKLKSKRNRKTGSQEERNRM